MKPVLEKLNMLISSLEKVLRENKRNKSIEDFEGDCSDMLGITKDCVFLYQKFCNYHQEINAQLSVSRKKLLEAQNKQLELEQKSKVLKKDLIKTCKCIEDFEEKELQFKKRIATLENKIINVEPQKDVIVPRKEIVIEEEAERERQLLNSRVTQLEASLRSKEDSEQEIKLKLLDTVAGVEKLEHDVEDLRLKLKHELDRSQKVVKDKVFIEKESRDKDGKIKELEENILQLQKRIEELNLENNMLKSKIASYLSKISNMKEIRVKAAKQVGQQIKTCRSISEEKDKLALLLEKKDEDIKALNGKLINLINDKEAMLQKYLRIESQKQSSDEKIKFLKSELMNTEKDIMKMKKQISQHNFEVTNLNREKELLAKNIMKMESLMKKYESDFKNVENEKIGLYRELKASKLENEKQRSVNSVLEGLKSQLLLDIKKLTKKIEVLNEELCNHEESESSMKQRTAELSCKLSEQVHITNAAILDRKMFCQQYKEIKENRDEMKQKIDNLENYVNELKETLCNKNKEINTWKEKYEMLDLRLKSLNSQFAEQKSEYDVLQNKHKHLDELYNSHLQKSSKKEKEVEFLQTKVNQLSEECRILHRKVHKQIKEITSLEEKIKFSESALEAEKEKFFNFQNSTQFFQLEILRLTGEKNSLVSRINDLEKLKRSFTYAKEELHKERFKNSALERAMQQPLNVHRWRLLKGTDPEKHELLENCQTIQKQLLKKCAESEEKDKKLSNMDKLIQQLKSMTSRQKDLEDKYMNDAKLKVQLQSKNDEIKALKFETSMYMSYMESCKAEIKHLQNELQKIKTRQFLKQKSKSSQEKEE